SELPSPAFPIAVKANELEREVTPATLRVELKAPVVADKAASVDAPVTLSVVVTDAELSVANPEVERVERPVAPATLRVELKAPVVADKAASVDAPVTLSVVVTDAELSVANPEVERVERPVAPATVNPL